MEIQYCQLCGLQKLGYHKCIQALTATNDFEIQRMSRRILKITKENSE